MVGTFTPNPTVGIVGKPKQKPKEVPKPTKLPDAATEILYHEMNFQRPINTDSTEKELHDMAKKPYKFLDFLDNDISQMTGDQKEYLRNEIEKTGANLDQGIYRQQPHLMAALGERLLQEARKRMGLNEDGSSPEAQPTEESQEQGYKPGSFRPGLFKN